MSDRTRVWKGLALACLISVAAFGCADSTVHDGNTTDCPDGERYNPVSGQCQVVSGDGDAQVPPRNNQSSNNTTPGTDNNSASPGNDNNSTPTNNNGTGDNNTPDDPSNGDNGPSNNAPGDNNDAGQNNGTNNSPGDSNNAPGDNNNNQSEDPAWECGPGKLIGRACAPSGAWLVAAEVSIEGYDCDGEPFTLTTTTDADGEFSFDSVDANTMGPHTLTVRTGSFESSRSVTVSPGVTSDLTSEAAKMCLNAGSVQIAVISGAFDDVEDILDELQLSYDIKGGDSGSSLTNSVAFLSDLQQMLSYDILFINCGLLWDRITSFSTAIPAAQLASIVSNIREFVKAGKSFYASDMAHPFIQQAFPDMINFYGNNNIVNDARIGYAPQSIQANVHTTAMQTLLGGTTAQVEFPHNIMAGIENTYWTVATEVGPDAVAHLRGNAQLCNLSTGCASSSGTQNNAPLLVTYKEPTNGGTAIFTSFHNKAQATYGGDMEKIMRFLIFQL